MSITQALATAVSGLTVSGRGTETVASNLANIMTPGFARREMDITSRNTAVSLGGVRVEGIKRIVNMTLLAETRAASSAQTDADTRAQFLQGMERLSGIAGEPGSLGGAFAEFQAAVASATARPEDMVRLSNVLSTATTLATKINRIGDGIQAARTEADMRIAADVKALNDGLDRVAELNRRIIALKSGGIESLALEDERQVVVDRLANIVPLQQVEREGGKIALFTAGGAVLIDGSQPQKLDFTAAGMVDVTRTLANGGLSGLGHGGIPVHPDRMSFFAGGSLAANFAIRDELAPRMQRDLDAVALELHDRMADPALDATLGTRPAMFTDMGGIATLGDVDGLSSRLRVNAAIIPAQGGELFRIRDGMGAATPGPVGDSALLMRMDQALAGNRDMADTPSYSGKASMEGFLGQFASRVASRRVSADAELSASSSRMTTLMTRLKGEGVDSDDEMRRLLQYEQAYNANAKVIQTIDKLMDTLLRI